MSNLIEAMFQYGVQLTQAGLEGDSDAAALQDNLVSLYRARAYAQVQEVDALRSGASDAGRVRMAGSALEGQQRLAYATGGVDSSSGTAAATIASSRIFSELGAATALNNARREALGYAKAQSDLTQRAADEVRAFKARAAKRTGDIVGAGFSVVGEALSMGGGK